MLFFILFYVALALGTAVVGIRSGQAVRSVSRTGNAEVATFAGGCFWCTEADFKKAGGVLDVISGYTGGHRPDPSYRDVVAGETGHVEAVQVIYDPRCISYAELLEIFWRTIDPTDGGGQFADRGPQYRTAIYYHNPEQKALALASKEKLARSGRYLRPIVTEILEAQPFFKAEDYHQDYFRKSPLRYNLYRSNSGRDRYLREIWDRPGSDTDVEPAPRIRPKAPVTDEMLRQRLSPLQYRVTRQNGTEPPFENEYWLNKTEGIYVDIVSGEPLFSSLHKYDSGTGWPSFTRPLEPGNIVEKTDRSFFMTRTEVRSRHGDSHLGHVFPDGPAPGGRRYCINSAALKFIARRDLKSEGYGQYEALFEE